jgi:hypothetical protein
MRRKDLDYLVIAVMFLSGLYVAVSGLVAGLFGFPQFFLHRYAGTVCVGLILFHLALNWGRVNAYLRRRLRRRGRIAQPIEPPAPTSRLRAGGYWWGCVGLADAQPAVGEGLSSRGAGRYR